MSRFNLGFFSRIKKPTAPTVVELAKLVSPAGAHAAGNGRTKITPRMDAWYHFERADLDSHYTSLLVFDDSGVIMHRTVEVELLP